MEILSRTTVTCTQRQEQTLNGLERIHQAARKDKNVRFTSLMHHITIDLLRDSFKSLKRNAKPGVDEVTWQQYGEQLEDHLPDLHRRVQSGRYKASPSKRIWIPKADGRQRPIGIAVLEDKVVQQATVTVLNQIYEVDFLGFSYGFRPKRSQHNALDAVWVGITQRKVNWVLDADVSGFFDNIDHQWLMKFIEHRIADTRLLRLIKKWLRAGVSDEGEWSKTLVGTPQGAVISPLLANIYLHYVLDLWVDKWRKGTRGDVIIVRYADDWVMGIQYQNEAERFLQEVKERMAKFGLSLHQEKTRLIEFGRLAIEARQKRGVGKPETFNFLGFVHVCGKTRKNNKFTIRRKTITKKSRAKLKELRAKIMKHRHLPVPDQGKWLRSVLIGHFNYYGVPGNRKAIDSFRTEVMRTWFYALRRRSQKARTLNWDRIKKLVRTWLPTATIKHPYPSQRLRVTYQR
jgi:RNA-directed DNA polymerase